MGALFRARQVIIWTDVDGVYSADLRKVGDVVILKTLSYQEAWGMANINVRAVAQGSFQIFSLKNHNNNDHYCAWFNWKRTA
ncbi:Bifunctional aspartokinase/homoserine dehydrogenase, chloroplastic isoform B [Glycine soja]|uniref:Bifunctional aspartokinase/homoserine dehydrogenase, chloroplastic isoform B n=1 Tax=Glycine soja TaxID=3848 RepID=A0A445HGR5_GLYSO|nr:Bifunctional aspartokinase/homoserine dehydrogenase, chloroplastic isoform B [Glycine soja]